MKGDLKEKLIKAQRLEGEKPRYRQEVAEVVHGLNEVVAMQQGKKQEKR